VWNSKRDLMAAFSQYDRDNDGHISIDEARLFLSNEPFNFSKEKVNYSIILKITTIAFIQTFNSDNEVHNYLSLRTELTRERKTTTVSITTTIIRIFLLLLLLLL